MYGAVWSEITSMIWDQNCTTWSSIATLLHPFWNRTILKPKYKNYKILVSTIIYWASGRFVKKRNQKCVCDWLFCFAVLFSLGVKKMRFRAKKMCDLWINRTAESQSDCKDNQWLQNGFNKVFNCHKHCKAEYFVISIVSQVQMFLFWSKKWRLPKLKWLWK